MKSGAELNFHSFLASIFFQIRPPLSKHCATQVTKIGVLIATLLFCRHHVFGNGHWGIFFVKLNSNPEWSLLTIWLPLELKKAICTLLKKTAFKPRSYFFFFDLVKFIYFEKAKNFAKSPLIIWLAVNRTNDWWRFHKILWPSQNI